MCLCMRVCARVYIYKVAEMTLWAMASLVLTLPFALRMVSTLFRLTLLGTSVVGASALCRTLQSPLSLEHDPVWGSVLINGWQSFSYAGYQRTDVVLGILGALRRALWLLGIWTQQPAPQTGQAFSGAFHEGGCMPPRAWLGREGCFPAWLSPVSWRQACILLLV